MEVKINQPMRVGRETTTSMRERSTHDLVSFQHMMKEQGKKLSVEQLTRLMTEIERQGERLTKRRTIEELRVYKDLVKKFVNEVVKFGVKLEDVSSFHIRGRDRRLKLLKELDKKLLELTDEILEENKESIDILARIGEIKGLLLNLYF
jgi:uncharacterized protein YaaR (DUF327 family)